MSAMFQRFTRGRAAKVHVSGTNSEHVRTDMDAQNLRRPGKSITSALMKRFEDAVDNEPQEEKIMEPPSSWHHAARLKCVTRRATAFQRGSWFCSSLILVIVQMCVMLSFLSALSARRCTSHDDCDHALYCSGLRSSQRMRDPLDSRLYIQRGICLGCGTRMPDDSQVDSLLEGLCPDAANVNAPASNSSMGILCLSACMSTCTAQSPFPITTRHVDEYSDGEVLCATSCASSCAATLTGELVHLLDQAMSSPARDSRTRTSRLYQVWLSIIDQCGHCAPSIRQGIRFATPPEAENDRIMKMSFLDFVSLGLTSLIVALTMMREVRDMNVGVIMTLQAVHRDAARLEKGDDEATFELSSHSFAWRYALGMQAFLRRYSILPDVGVVVVLMVARLGGDTVSIMLNTLAALFMLELDNLAFDYGLTAGTKALIEEAFVVELGASQLQLLNWSRRWHVVTVTLFILVITTTLPYLTSIWLRLRVLSLLLIAIIALGELMELVMRFSRRTRSANAQRIVCFVLKVAAAVLYKWQIVEYLAYLADSSTLLD